jgi:hypothetical protein
MHKTSSSSLFSEVKYYMALSKGIQSHLSKYPYDWAKFQEQFNSIVEKISLNLLQFEKNNIKTSEDKIYKFKRIFEKRYRNYFLYGDLTKWTYKKPFGYAGDFKIIDDIYQNTTRTIGFDGLWDTYYLQMTASKAVRERKDTCRKTIYNFVKENKNRAIRIMNLASGPAREIKELLEDDPEGIFSKVIFDCYDLDTNAINYAKQLINNTVNVTFFQKNAIRIALKKEVKQEVPYDYDLIYSAGLFDYLDEKVAIRLIGNLRKLLKKNGKILIANFGNKYNNSSAGLMEWVTEWFLIYRTELEFKRLFLNAGFSEQNLEIFCQPDKTVLYCLAHNY